MVVLEGVQVVLNENPSVEIPTVKLDESNYFPWTHSALLAIQKWGPSDYLTWEAKEPKLGGPFILDGFQRILLFLVAPFHD